MENIAAIRGSLLTPFGSPQNLFIFGKSGVSAIEFVLYMLPICLVSGVLLICFVLFLYRKDIKEQTSITGSGHAGEWDKKKKGVRIAYLIIFAVVLATIVSRTGYWMFVAIAVVIAVLIIDRKLLIKTDYVLLLTFLSFFIFSSSVAHNQKIADFLSSAVSGSEYIWSILLSQIISNVPAGIVLYPFAVNKGALIYGLDSAGLCTLIGSLASYVREYPENGKKFIKVFTLISLLFFAFVAVPGYFISLRPL